MRRRTTLAALVALASCALALPSVAQGSDVPTHHVRGSVTVEPGGYVEDIYLHLTDDEGYTMGDATLPGTGGTFDMEDVEDGGPYTLEMTAEPDFDWRTQYYPDTFFRSDAGAITVAGTDVDLQPMTLHAMHDVHGQVVAAGKPLTSMRLTAYPAGPGVTSYSKGLSAYTDDEDGTYDLGLPAGTWKIRFSGVSEDPLDDLVTTWAPEWYLDGSSFAEATPVTVPGVTDLGTTTLTDGGSISGTVTDSATGLPVRGIDVQVVDADNRTRGTVVTRNDGSYTVGLLATGAYKVKALDNQAHAFLTQYYDGSATNAGATPVPVLTDHATSDIDVALVAVAPPDPSTVVLGGTVTDQTGAPVRGVAVSARTSCGADPAVAYTDLAGHYAFTGLTAAQYRITFTDAYGDADDDSFEVIGAGYGGPTCATSTPAPLGTLHADVALTRYGGIAGTLFSQYAGAPYVPRHAQVLIYREPAEDPEDDYPDDLRRVDRDGSWSFGRLEPGTYKLFFDEDYWGGYRTHWWEDAPTRAAATEIAVTSGGMVSGLDAHLWPYVDCGDDLEVLGEPRPGQTLSVAPGQYCSGRDLTYSYSWVLTHWDPFEQIVVGTDPSYTVQPDDYGYDIRLHLHVTGPDGSADVESDPHDVAMPTTPPPEAVNTTLPSISGAPHVGETLTANPGTWQGPQVTFAYLWIKNHQSTGVTTPTYVVKPADLGATIELRVDAVHRQHHTWAFAAPVLISTPPSSPVPTTSAAVLTARARITGAGRGREPGVRLLVRVPAGLTPGVSQPGLLVVREDGRQVAALPARRGVNRLDLPHVRHGRHRYVVSFTGTVDGVVPDPVVVKVRVPRRH